MGNWSDKQEVKKEIKEKDKTRRENIAKYFLDLSKLTFTALVLGTIAPSFINFAEVVNWHSLSIGIILTALLANIGNKILK